MQNRRELLAAMRRELPPRIPYTYGAETETNDILLKHLGLGADGDVGRHFQCNSFASLWGALGGGPQMPERNARRAALARTLSPGAMVDIWGIRREWVQAGDIRYLEITHAPLSHCDTIAEVEAYDWPRADEVVWPDVPTGLDLPRWKETEDVFVMLNDYICPFGIPWAMTGMEKMMMDLIANPGVVEAIVAKVEEYTLACLRMTLEKYPGGVDAIGCGDDYGTQNGLLLSPEMIARFFMPSLKRHYSLGKRGGTLCYHHSCGAVFDMIPLFIDAGLDVLNPVQTSAAGMDPARLKRHFGSHLAFHGGIDIQQTLVTGTPEEVRAEVRNRVQTLGPAGYILAPSHVLQPDAPPENIVALYDEVQKFTF